MEIFNLNGELILSVQVDDSSYRYRAIKGEHNLTLRMCQRYEINTPLRMAHFLAQVCHESGLNGFKEREKYLLRAKKALGI